MMNITNEKSALRNNEKFPPPNKSKEIVLDQAPLKEVNKECDDKP